MFQHKQTELPSADEALAGRTEKMSVPSSHFVLGTPLEPPFPASFETALFALGCFWGAEKVFWPVPGVFTTAVGYIAGSTPNPTYEEVCSGRTGHTEAVLVVFDPARVSYEDLLRLFWESHDPTQGMQQGNDRGTQYRSGVYTLDATQAATAAASREAFGTRLAGAGFPAITTEVEPAESFYYAEEYHQQYLGKNPRGYCGLSGTGVSCPIGVKKVG